MRAPPMKAPAKSPLLAWLVVGLAGAVLPAAAMFLLRGAPAPAPLALVGGPILAVGLMGIGMIAAATARHGCGSAWRWPLLAAWA
jgi:hypothetical protein